MVQSPLTMTLRTWNWAAALSTCLLLSGCASFQPSSVHDTAARSGAAGRKPVPRVASRRSPPHALAAATPFTWTNAAEVGSGEHLQIASVGDHGFRTLVIGSVGGNDPAAIRLTEDLARYLHGNNIIVGGIQSTILRTLNPDGLRRRKHRNAAGIYLNNQFPVDGSMPDRFARHQLPREVQFVMGLMEERRPQRIIHIRTVKGKKGLLAASRGAMNSAREVADWLGFKLQKLPESARTSTLESWASQRDNCDIVTFGIPRSSDKSDVWPLFGDALVSLLLDGNTESRQIARQQKRRRAAREDHQGKRAKRSMSSGMFNDDTAHERTTSPFE